MGFPGGSEGKESACNVGDLGSISGWRRYSYLENTHEQRSLVGYSRWGHKESDMTEQLHFQCIINLAVYCVCTSLHILQYNYFLKLK